MISDDNFYRETEEILFAAIEKTLVLLESVYDYVSTYFYTHVHRRSQPCLNEDENVKTEYTYI